MKFLFLLILLLITVPAHAVDKLAVPWKTWAVGDVFDTTYGVTRVTITSLTSQQNSTSTLNNTTYKTEQDVYNIVTANSGPYYMAGFEMVKVPVAVWYDSSVTSWKIDYQTYPITVTPAATVNNPKETYLQWQAKIHPPPAVPAFNNYSAKLQTLQIKVLNMDASITYQTWVIVGCLMAVVFAVTWKG